MYALENVIVTQVISLCKCVHRALFQLLWLNGWLVLDKSFLY